MTPLAAFLAELGRLDVRLVLDGDKLRVDAPKSALAPELRAALVERKAEIVAHLRASSPRDAGAPAPSPGQHRLWSLSKLKADRAAYNVPTAFRLAGPLDERALAASLGDVERRHEPLRTTFRDVAGEPVPEVHEAAPVSLPVVDRSAALAGLDAAARDEAISRELRDESRTPFDLAAERPWRAKLLRIGPDDHVLVLTMHHIAFDGRSKPIFLHELAEAYRARVSGREPAFVPLPARYADFAAWQRGAASDAADRHLDWWRRKLEGAAELELPADRPRPETPSRGARSTTFALPAPLAKALRGYARQEQSSLYIVLLAAFGALLHGRTGQDDLLVCSPFASRDRVEFEGLIGYLNTIVPLRIDAGGAPAFHELVARVRRTALEAFEHQQVPLQRLAELPELARVSLSRALFSYQDSSTRTLELEGVAAAPIDLRKAGSDFDLAFYAEGTRDGGVGGIVEYDADRFDDATIARLVADLERLLAAAIADPHRPVASLPRSAPDAAAVEQRLQAHRQIDRAAVGRRPGHAGTIAWLVLNEHDVPRLDDIRAFLRSAFPGYLVPSAIVTVDRMPLLPDGRIDRAALPHPPAQRNRAGTPYVAPRTPLERRLAEVWKRVLWLDIEVGVDDRFADLGGHSLLSAQLVVELERELGRPVPTRALAELSTVAAMARLLDEAPAATPVPASPRVARTGPAIAPEVLDRMRSYTASWVGERASPESLVIGMNVAGTRTPLFWCLQRYQELTQLARYLGPDQPVFGMRSGNRVMEKTPANIVALARHYADEILALRPSGPLAVGGNCQAARIAFQIARILAGRGREPALLILHEKFIAEPYGGRVALMFGRESERNPYLHYVRPEAGWRKFYAGPVSFDFVQGAHTEFFVEPNVQVLTDAIRRRLAGDGPMLDEALPRPAQRMPVEGYRVRFAANAPAVARPGAPMRLDVDVTNDGPVEWRPFDESGIVLVDRWLDAQQRSVTWIDGWLPLPRAIAPGATVRLALDAKAPARPGRYVLVVDLVDEGVATFNARGSTLATFAVTVGEPAGATDYNAASMPGVQGP